MKTKETRDTITYEEFTRADFRVGRIKEVYHLHSDSLLSTYRVIIDFGAEIGTRKGVVELTDNYSREDLEGRLVVALVNLSPEYEVEDETDTVILKIAFVNGKDVLLRPDWEVPLGCRVI